MPAPQVVASEDVAQIIPDAPAGFDFQPYIQGAAALIAECELRSAGLGQSALFEIERNLAAAFWDTSGGGVVKSRSYAGASVSYVVGTGGGLQSSSYFNMAAALDKTGRLKNTGRRGATFSTFTVP